jgi:NRAMP (natural resistance-associated macrophage protein)-like metal ion transporter
MFKWFKNAGPGALVAAAFIGPGTVTVCTIAGVRFGYDLIWAMVLSTLATIVLQEMAARLGIITRKGLSDVIRQEIKNPFVKYIIVALILFAIVVGNAVYEAGNISGGRLGLETLFGSSSSSLSKYLSVIIGIIAFVVLYIGNYKVLERALVSLVILMSLAFVITSILTKPNLLDVLKGVFVPSVNETNLLTIVGLIGTTVVPYNLFLHASLVKEKWKTQDDLHYARKDTIISVALGGLVSIAIIISAASTNVTSIASAADLAKGLEPLFGSFAKYFLSIGLFAAGITSAITAPLAAAYVANGCMGWGGNLKSFKFRIVWMFVLFLGIIFSSLGINPIEIIQFAQVANGAALPIIVGIILWIMNKESVLGKNRNSKFQNAIGIIIFIVSIVLGLKSIIQVINSNSKMSYSIDINCDLGEGTGNDALLMPYLSSCNIASGGHAGDEASMKETIRLALEHNVKIGAHPSFPDRENFGRTEMNLPNNELTTIIIEQILQLKILTEEAGGKINHVKPHGALYNMAAVNDSTAEAILDALTSFDKELILYVPYGSVIAKKALDREVPIKYEAFADRNYNKDLTLVSRKLDNAVLEDPAQITEHVVRMIKEKKVKTINGDLANIEAGTLCIHGDNPHAVEIVSQLVKNLKDNKVSIE